MRRAFMAVALVVVLVVVGNAAPSGAAEGGRVLIVSYPGLQWDDVLDVQPPVLLSVLNRAAVASLSVRTIGPLTTLGEAYATIGAGNRATADELAAGQAYPADATVEGDDAATVLARRCGCGTADAAVVHLGLPRVQRTNDRLLYDAQVGALGTALADANKTAAVIANADRSRAASADAVHRDAALAAVDREGRVAHGSVGAALLEESDGAPFGVRLSHEAVLGVFRDAWTDASLVVLEMSDLARADRYAEVSTSRAAAAVRDAAIRRSDLLLAAVLADVDAEGDLVVVLGPAGPRGRSELTVAAFAGPGFDAGAARSATTRRDGFVTLTDIAPTALDFLEIEAPEMTGTIASASGGGVDLDLLRDFARDNELAVFRDAATGPASVTFIVIQVAGYALAALALTRWRGMRRAVASLLLVPLAQTSLAFLSRLVAYDALTVPGYVVVLFAGGLALALGAEALGRLVRRRIGDAAVVVPPLSLVALTMVVLVVDILMGGPLQLNTVFGYSPIVAGRFAGYGNLAFALLASTSILVVTGAWSVRAMRGRPPATTGLALAATAMAMVVVVDGLPSLGADVGGVLALVPAGAVVVLLLAGVRLRWGHIVLIAAAAGGALATFALVDLARPEESRTHLGRLAAKVLDADEGGVGTVLRRKLEANVSILMSSVWTWVIPVALGFLVFLVWRRPGSLRAIEERVPGLRAGLVGSLVAGLIGFALNDSGIAVPAMMLAVVLPYVAFLVVRTAD